MSAAASRRALLGSLAALPALTIPAAQAVTEPDPHEAYRERLYAAHREKRQVRPVDNVAPPNSLEAAACSLVFCRLWRLADEVLALPMPRTPSGLGIMALAFAVIQEGCVVEGDNDIWRAAQLARGIMAITGEPLPPDWCCWGDAPGDWDRDAAVLDGPGHIPAWALEEAARQCA